MPPDEPDAAAWDEGHLRLAVKAAGVALWSWNVDTNKFAMDRHGCRLWGCLLYTSDAADE